MIVQVFKRVHDPVCMSTEILESRKLLLGNDFGYVGIPASNISYNVYFSFREFEDAISRGVNTAPGQDQLSYLMLQHLDEGTKHELLMLFNYIWEVFNDSIHGHVELPSLLVKIIDTPQFQRLRNIKQLGGGYLVYPGASHNRFEHSIGVAYLAGELVKTLREKQPELDINVRDILCVQIAGLCHDLGHGPFSHLFDQMFMPQVRGNHEKASLDMFEYLVRVNELDLENEGDDQENEGDDQEDGDDDQNDGEDDLVFIKELILGKPLNGNDSSAGWPYKGRKVEKSFLYEIVSNKESGIDVDKFDYFARDCYHTGIKNNFEHLRYFKFARVIEVETNQSTRRRICLRDKVVGNLYDLFHTRLLLHRRVCHHKVTTNVQIMIKDALLKANGHLKISDATKDMEAYTKLTDQVTERILHSTGNDMKEAREILVRVMRRDLYKLVGEAKVSYSNNSPYLHYGKGKEDPIKYTYFYKKNDIKTAFTIPRNKVSNFLPECFLEQTIRVYWKNNDKKNLKEAKQEFQTWCENNGFEVIFRTAMLDLTGFMIRFEIQC
uniref:HD/PDEase domain-containing protein n=1 Tax=Oryzias melastigma TaxID=30732 RepID=A0A3B3DHA3_ORYME